LRTGTSGVRKPKILDHAQMTAFPALAVRCPSPQPARSSRDEVPSQNRTPHPNSRSPSPNRTTPPSTPHAPLTQAESHSRSSPGGVRTSPLAPSVSVSAARSRPCSLPISLGTEASRALAAPHHPGMHLPLLPRLRPPPPAQPFCVPTPIATKQLSIDTRTRTPACAALRARPLRALRRRPRGWWRSRSLWDPSVAYRVAWYRTSQRRRQQDGENSTLSSSASSS
jgi:hypothetical protein